MTKICPFMSWRSGKEKPCLEKLCALWTGSKCSFKKADVAKETTSAGQPTTTTEKE